MDNESREENDDESLDLHRSANQSIQEEIEPIQAEEDIDILLEDPENAANSDELDEPDREEESDSDNPELW